MSKKIWRASIPSRTSTQKHVSVNILPCGSPTFQRAMKGLQPSREFSDSDEEQEENKVKESKSKLSFSQRAPLIRTNSADQHVVAERKSVSACSTPKLTRPQTSYEKGRYSRKRTDIVYEAKDKLTHLPVTDSPFPLKSILKNRKHSFDDLDVSTKKGLAMYLKEKQREQHHHINVHFH